MVFRRLSDHRDMGNGIWLPTHVTDTHYNRTTGDVERQVVIDYEIISVNERISDEVFTNIFPEDVTVVDSSQNQKNKEGREGSNGQIPGSGIRPPQDPSRYRTWLIALNVLIVGVGVTVVAVPRIRRRYLRT